LVLVTERDIQLIWQSIPGCVGKNTYRGVSISLPWKLDWRRTVTSPSDLRSSRRKVSYNETYTGITSW